MPSVRLFVTLKLHSCRSLCDSSGVYAFLHVFITLLFIVLLSLYVPQFIVPISFCFLLVRFFPSSCCCCFMRYGFMKNLHYLRFKSWHSVWFAVSKSSRCGDFIQDYGSCPENRKDITHIQCKWKQMNESWWNIEICSANRQWFNRIFHITLFQLGKPN